MNRMPTLFISHGAPNVILHDLPVVACWDGLAATMSRPRAIVVCSAHYETPESRVTASPRPPTIHDFSGFEPELYAMEYRAPGDPELAARIIALLAQAGIDAALDDEWGLDHGAWIPLSRIYPDADIPVLQVSLTPGMDTRGHLALGRALQSLRELGVLVCGSGNLNHNLRQLQPPVDNDRIGSWAAGFIDWMAQRLAAGDTESLLDYRLLAPNAVENHPSEEHIMPLFVAMGAAGTDWRATREHASINYGNLAMDLYRFD